MSVRKPTAPITTAVAETESMSALATSSASDASSGDVEQDFRPLWLHALRWLAHGWWKLFAVVVVGNFVPGAALAALQGGADALRSYVTTWGLLRPVETSHPLVFWPAAAALAALAVVGLGAELEERRTTARRDVRLHQAAQEAQAQSALAQETAQRALEAVNANAAAGTPVPQPLGPPDDVALLPAPERFVGRADDLAWVEQRLRAGGASAITALRGLGGIGKTTLAAVAVRDLQQEGCFPDGIAVVLCQQLTDPAEVLRRVLIRFDPYRRAPEATELPRVQDIAQATLRGKRALVVLDGVEPELPVAAVVTPLRSAALTLLLTSRQTLPGEAVPAEASHALDLLRSDEALELFASALGRGRPDTLTPAERTSAEQIVAALGYHTLAVKLAGAYAAAERRNLTSLASELADPAEGLALPGDDETPKAVRRSFALSLDALPAEARQLFGGLAAFATTECGRQAALAVGRALGQQHPAENLHLLLVRALVEPSTNETLPAASDVDRERLRLHPLLRALAEELFATWPGDERDTAALAVAQYLAGYAEAHQTDHVALAADEGNLTGALEWAKAHDQPEMVADLAHGMRDFWDRRGRIREGVRYLAWGVAATEASGLGQGNPETRRQAAELGVAYGRLMAKGGELEAGADAAQHSLDIFRATQDRRGEGAAFLVLGETAMQLGQHEAAEGYLEQSLAIRREVGDRPGEGSALTTLGLVALWRGRYEAAEGYFKQGLTINNEVDDQLGKADCLTYLGQVVLRRGHYEEAEGYLAQALLFDREVGDRQGEGVDLMGLGEVALRRGHYEEAQDYLNRALTTMREIGDRLGEGVAPIFLGEVAMRQGHYDVAEGYLEQGVAINNEVGVPRWQARSLCALGRVVEAQGDLARAETLYRQSLTLATDKLSGPEIATAQLALGLLLAEQLDRREERCPLLVEAARRFGEMGMPEAEEARAAVARLGCA